MRLPAPASMSARPIGQKVACTVISVIPYMLIRRVRSGSLRWIHGRSVCSSSASPPNTMQRSRCASLLRACSAISCWKALGVWFSTVTPSRHSSA